MDWKVYKQPVWYSSMKSKEPMDFHFCKADIDDGAFIILPHYTKKFQIKGYSVWFQAKSHITQGGDNFALKIRKCDSFNDGRRIAENFYDEFKAGNEPKYIGTQYFESDIYIEGPFI